MKKIGVEAPTFEMDTTHYLEDGTEIQVRELTYKEYTSFDKKAGRTIRSIYNEVETGLLAILKEIVENKETSEEHIVDNQALLIEYGNIVVEDNQDKILEIVALTNNMSYDELVNKLDFATADEITKHYAMLVIGTSLKKTLVRMDKTLQTIATQQELNNS